MQPKKLKLITVLLLSLGLTEVQAQNDNPASGGNASGTGGSASYTVGQIVYTTNTGTNGTVAQGVQQPYEVSVATAIEEAKGISLNCTAYPNPATDFLTLKVEKNNTENLSYQLYDMNGKLLESKKVKSNETTISIGIFKSGNYFLKVIQDSKEVKSFKIIKITNYEKTILHFNHQIGNGNGKGTKPSKNELSVHQ